MGMATILKKMLIGRAFTTEKGRVKFFGTMDWTLCPSRAFAITLQKIGEDKGREYLNELGRIWCEDAAKEMVKAMHLKPKGGWVTQNAIIALLDFIGWGKMEFIKSEIKKDGHHHVILHELDNPVITWAARLYGPKSVVCEFFMGGYGAHGEEELGIKNIKLKENKCVCKGAPYCEWETKW